MKLEVQDALIHLMAITGAADRVVSDLEIERIEALVGRLPVFEGVPSGRVHELVLTSFAAIGAAEDVEHLLVEIVDAIPERLYDTAYALAVEVAVVDLHLPQEELRWLEMIRDQLPLDRLVTAAIETAARARLRKA